MATHEPSARDVILGKLREKRVPRPTDYPLPGIVTLGDMDRSVKRFEDALQLLGGDIWAPQSGETLEDAVRRKFPDAGSICSATDEFKGTLKITDLKTLQEADKVDVMVVRSPFGIAEMGSIFLSEVELHDHLADVHLAQHLIVLLSRTALTANMHTAYQERQEFKTAGYGVLMSGPSATADIQGVLIRGAQGVRSLTVIWTD
ncbi:LUD domain-containing protein [Acetobacteraceae bacterium ESL0709]|nr:LUD domain-containing protein [Acetobacteraceae bacterium ESL0697]MDF7678366.1 LUD domain-containing protein [Acetobacteraceae bacterium ESL0709]